MIVQLRSRCQTDKCALRHQNRLPQAKGLEGHVCKSGGSVTI